MSPAKEAAGDLTVDSNQVPLHSHFDYEPETIALCKLAHFTTFSSLSSLILSMQVCSNFISNIRIQVYLL